ncbi:MAG: Hsp20/alpha crystallin family protein [Methylotenera sp.]|nr:Hsp20/alpha crystallin family protein [Oligoflexia bacterium]
MSVSPTGSSGSGGSDQSRLAQSRAAQVYDAEKEARDKIQSAQKQITETQHETDVRLDSMKDGYIRQSETQHSRQEELYENQKQKGYESIRNLKRAQEAEINRVKREGDKDLTAATTYYRDTTTSTERKGEQDLKEIQTKSFIQNEYQKKVAADQTAAAREAYTRQIGDLKSDQESNYSKILETSQQQNDELRARSSQEIAKSDATFQDRFKSTKANQEHIIGDLNARASQQVEEIRQSTSQNLEAYTSRQSDPFYKMMDIGASLEENDQAFVLTAHIPEHERDRVTVSVRGDEIVLSGTRRNEEKLELEPHRVQSTNSYQSFSESFPLNWPVDSRKLSREFKGDQLIVTIPKKATYEPAPFQAKKVERSRVERPHFPFNLPPAGEVKTDGSREGFGDDPVASTKNKGSGTLS